MRSPEDVHNAVDQTSAWQLSDAGAGVEPVIADEALQQGHIQESLQVAGLGSGLSRAMRRGTADIMRGALKPGSLTPDEEALLSDTLRTFRRTDLPDVRRERKADIKAGLTAPGAPAPTEKYTPTGTINVERQAPGSSRQDYVRLAEMAEQKPHLLLKAVENAEDLGALLDSVGKGMQFQKTVKGHDVVKVEAEDLAILAPLLSGKQAGLANDSQLLALRNFSGSIGMETVKLARKIYQGAGTQEDILRYEQYGQQYLALIKFQRGQVSGVARALSQQRIIAEGLSKGTMEAIEASLQQSNGPAALVKNASALIQLIDSGMTQQQALDSMMPRRTLLEAGIEFWKANNLSSPVTQVKNILGNATTALYETTVVKPIGAVIGEARHAALGAMDYMSGAEAAYSLFGGMRGIYDGTSFFLKTLMEGESQFAANMGKEEMKRGAVPDYLDQAFGESGRVAGEVLTWPFRLMRAEDDAFKAIGYRSQVEGLAARDGIKQGLQGDALSVYVDQTLAAVPDNIHSQALEFADKVTLQDKEVKGIVGLIGDSVANAVQNVPMLHFVLPWIRTPARIGDYMIEASVFAAASPRIWKQFQAGGAERDIATARVIAGAGISVAAYAAWNSGLITGAGPIDPGQKAALVSSGWQEYAIKLNGEYYSVKGAFDPILGALFSIATGFERAQYARREQDSVREAMGSVLGMTDYMLDSSYLDSVRRLLDALQDPTGKALLKMIVSIGPGFIPSSALIGAAARAGADAEGLKAKAPTESIGFGGTSSWEDIKRMTGQEFAARLPGFRDALRPQRYWDGTPMVLSSGKLAQFSTPFKSLDQNPSKSDRELALKGISAVTPSPLFSLAGVQFNLVDFDNGKGLIYDEYIKSIGNTRKILVDQVVASKGYAELPESRQALLLEQAMSLGAEAGKLKFLKQVPQLIEKDPESVSRLAGRMGTDLPGLLTDIRKGIIASEQGQRFISPEQRRDIELKF